MIVNKKLLESAKVRWERNDLTQLEPPKPGEIFPCCLCGKLFQVPQYVGKSIDLVCNECFKTYNDTAKVVCAACHSVVGRVVPKVLDSGYYVKPRSVLHVDKCGVCKENIVESTILEIAAWIKRNRRPIVYMSTGEIYKPKK